MINTPASRSYQAGAIIFNEGDIGDCSYFIESGQVEIFVQSQGQEKQLAVLSENDIFGEMAIIDRFPRSASARALTLCKVGIIHKEQLRDRLEDSDPVVKMLISVLIQRLRREVVERLKTDEKPLNAVEHELAEELLKNHSIAEKIQMPTTALHKFKMEGLLRNAIHNGEMDLHYQPIVNMKDRSVLGFEALLRWNNAQGKMLYPESFITVCEETNLIIPIGRWVIERALRDVAWMMDQTGQNLFVSINVSGRQIFDPIFFEHLENERKRHGLLTSNVKLEITEAVFVKGEKALQWVNEARSLGYTLALDDFGTGYSSFQYLSQLSLDFIKIDKSFVQGMSHDPKSFMITNAIIQLGKNFGIPTIAEGIEEQPQLLQLVGLNCEFGQGYLFAKPAARADAIQILQTRRLKSVS